MQAGTHYQNKADYLYNYNARGVSEHISDNCKATREEIGEGGYFVAIGKYRNYVSVKRFGKAHEHYKEGEQKSAEYRAHTDKHITETLIDISSVIGMLYVAKRTVATIRTPQAYLLNLVTEDKAHKRVA